MAYIKQNWKNEGEQDAIAINKEHLNHIEEGIANSESVYLLAVTDTAPAECNVGDEYYDTEDNLIYTATDTNVWSDVGREALKNVFYVVISENANYTYDGTTLVSVGGGKSEILIQETEPDEGKLWINPEEPLFSTGTEVVDSLEGNQSDLAPSVRAVKETLGYSAEEVKTGYKWIDGKPIYKKVVTGLTTTMGTQNSILINNNVDTIIKVDGFIKMSSTTKLPLAYSNVGASIFYLVDGNNLKVQVGNAGFENKEIYATVEYTKTTPVSLGNPNGEGEE